MMVNDDLKRIWDRLDNRIGPQRMETEVEHIARDIREGRFPGRSDPIQVAVNAVQGSPVPCEQTTAPPAAVVDAMERALRHADQVSRDLGWHRIYDETGAALDALTAWRAGK